MTDLIDYERAKAEEVFLILEKKGLLKQGDRVLDIGCSTGVLLDVAKSFNLDAVGLDVPAEGDWFDHYSSKEQRFIHDFQQGETHSIGIFDIVIMQEVVEHLKRPYDFFENLKSILKNTSIIYLTTPNLSGWSSKIKADDWCGVATDGHYILYNEKSLNFLMSKCGYSILDSWVTFIPNFYQNKYKFLRKFEKIIGPTKLGGSLQGIYCSGKKC